MTEQRIQEKDRLLTSIGFVLAPLRDLIYGKTPRDEISHVQARLRGDLATFDRDLNAFCFVDGASYATERIAAWNCACRFLQLCDEIRHSPPATDFRSKFEEILQAAQSAIRAIPCEQPEGIFSAETPFKTYTVLRSVFATVGKRLDLFDPYLDAEVFHLYLSEVPASVPINLITSSDIMVKAGANARRDRIVEVSTMFAAERPTTYRLAVAKDKSQHDRHLRADDALYHLGSSIKDAADSAPYTISKMPKTSGAVLDQIIADADEWFGRSVTSHRSR